MYEFKMHNAIYNSNQISDKCEQTKQFNNSMKSVAYPGFLKVGGQKIYWPINFFFLTITFTIFILQVSQNQVMTFLLIIYFSQQFRVVIFQRSAPTFFLYPEGVGWQILFPQILTCQNK